MEEYADTFQLYTPDVRCRAGSLFYKDVECYMRSIWNLKWKDLASYRDKCLGDFNVEIIYFAPAISCVLHPFALHAVEFTLSNCKLMNKDYATFYHPDY